MAINRPVGKPRKNEEFFPKIAEIIHHLYRKNQRFIRHDEILKGLQSTDAGARKRVGEYTQGFYEVCWFSAYETKYRNGDSSVLKWGPLFDQFERKKIQGRAAYKPISLDASQVHPDEVLAEESPEQPELREGAIRQVLVNAYERDPRARQLCIDEYGRRCVICMLSFGERYGKVAERIIHVHHLRELSEIRKEYVVDPIRDLCPVCPNCHAVLHSRKPAYTIEEVITFMRECRGRADAN